MKFGKNLVKLVTISAALSAFMLTGCTQRPDEEQLHRLEEARGAAQSAEQTRYEKVEERRLLEQEVSDKEGTLQRHEEERNDIQQQMDQREN
ncbi:hypothetical protein [Chitinivibrio alkaliphilus]|uniref:Lipoprotein n=1 Tax=Chitinivibrio alkaliphilus ACht1 TaxID=1313304 RepID=U7DAY1_9BACT|nr:hypothetical protein [Chitinivibrio alkaliphilus]ERP39187.1 hypothetical protein CALK_0357 [Chitinivibrio alkaliphilus ACht1]